MLKEDTSRISLITEISASVNGDSDSSSERKRAVEYEVVLNCAINNLKGRKNIGLS